MMRQKKSKKRTQTKVEKGKETEITRIYRQTKR